MSTAAMIPTSVDILGNSGTVVIAGQGLETTFLGLTLKTINNSNININTDKGGFLLLNTQNYILSHGYLLASYVYSVSCHATFNNFIVIHSLGITKFEHTYNDNSNSYELNVIWNLQSISNSDQSVTYDITSLCDSSGNSNCKISMDNNNNNNNIAVVLFGSSKKTVLINVNDGSFVGNKDYSDTNLNSVAIDDSRYYVTGYNQVAADLQVAYVYAESYNTQGAYIYFSCHTIYISYNHFFWVFVSFFFLCFANLRNKSNAIKSHPKSLERNKTKQKIKIRHTHTKIKGTITRAYKLYGWSSSEAKGAGDTSDNRGIDVKVVGTDLWFAV